MKARLSKTILALLLTIVLIVPLVLANVVMAEQEEPALLISMLYTEQETQIDEYTEVKRIGETYDHKGILTSIQYEATISSLPSFTDDGEAIDPQWYEVKDSAGYISYKSGNNLFTAIVTPEGRTSLQDSNGRLFVWTPVISIRTTLLSCDKVKVLSQDPYNEYYKNNVLQWTYTFNTGLFGLKKVTILRQLRIIEGAVLEYYVIDSNPGADLSVLRSRRAELGVATGLSDAIAFDSSEPKDYLIVENHLNGFIIRAREFNGRDYPIIIDPTSTFYTTTADACNTYQGAYGASYSSVWSATSGTLLVNGDVESWVGQNLRYNPGYGYKYFEHRSYVFFDTSSLPDNAVISYAQLSLWVTHVEDLGSYTSSVVIQSGQPTYPHNPVVAADYNKDYYIGNAGETYLDYFTEGQFNSIVLSATGIGWISKTGTTKFCLRTDEDINGTSPAYVEGETDSEYEFRFWQAEHGSGYAPKLSITYTVPIVPPTVTTVSAIDATETSLTLKGYLSSDGGEACTVKFEYGTTTSYGTQSSSVSGVTSGTYFSIAITGLDKGTTYHFRAIASNGAGSGYGLDKFGTTLPDVPTSFTATPGDEQNFLTWVKGTGASKTLVRFKTAGYPSSITDGTQVYFDTGTGTTHTGLTAGTTHYYSAWSESNGQYSTSYATTFATPYYIGAPGVTTRDATGVEVSSATLQGYLNALNQDSGTVACTFQYYYGAGSWVDNETTPPENLSSSGDFSKEVTGLQASTLYHFRAKAVGTNGTGYGADTTFTTGATSAPTITTQAATGAGLTYATLNGKVTDDGGLSTTVWFQWGLAESSLVDPTPTISGLYTDDVFYYSLTGLKPSTTYYFQAVGENNEGIGYGATLNFTTNSPASPVVTTYDASSVGANEAILAGIVIFDGGVACEVQFEYDTGSGAPYAYSTGWQADKQTDDEFTAIISGLDIDETYYFRACIKNAANTTYGSEKSFTTAFSAPTDFAAKSVGAVTVSLTWAKQGDQTYIVYKTSGYPVDRLDGTQVYFGDATSYTHDGLLPGITYFYRAWSWHSGDVWSEEYAEDAATTWPVRTSEEQEIPEIQGVPDEIPGMYQEPSEEHLANLPGYDSINAAADELGMPRGMFWLLISIGILIVLGLIIYIPTQDPMLTGIVLVVGMAVLAVLHIMPAWIPVVFVVLGLALSGIVKPGGTTG